MPWGISWGEPPPPTDLPPCPGLNNGPCSPGSVSGQINPSDTCPPCTTKTRKWKCENYTNPAICCDYYTCASSSTAGSAKNNPCNVA